MIARQEPSLRIFHEGKNTVYLTKNPEAIFKDQVPEKTGKQSFDTQHSTEYCKRWSKACFAHTPARYLGDPNTSVQFPGSANSKKTLKFEN